MHLFDPKKLKNLDDPSRLQEISLKKIANALQLKPGLKVADIGSGAGLFSFALQPLVQPHGEVVGFDIQEECIAYCREKLRKTPTPGLSFVKSTPQKIPAADSVFDAAILILLAHEIGEPLVFYNEVFRILNKGSKIVLVEWQPSETPKGPSVAERLAPGKLSEQLTQAGFTVSNIAQLNENHYILNAKK